MSSTIKVNNIQNLAGDDSGFDLSTNDQVKVKIANAEDFIFKANSLEVQTGSNIDMNGTELILDADGDTSITADTDDRVDVKVGGSDMVHVTTTGLGIGASSPQTGLHVEASDGSVNGTIRLTATSVASAGMAMDAQGLSFGTDTGGFTFKTSATANDPTDTGTERLKINSDGKLHIQTTTSAEMGLFENSFGSYGNVGVKIAVNRTSSGGNYNFLTCTDSAGSVTRLLIEDGGTVKNATGTYGSTSDEKLKENISDSGSQWDDIKAIRVRKFSLEEEKLEKPNMIGVIAQEAEASGMTGLVTNDIDRDADGEPTGTTTKSFKYSILYMKAVKALQEAMERIETLEAKVTALEGK